MPHLEKDFNYVILKKSEEKYTEGESNEKKY